MALGTLLSALFSSGAALAQQVSLGGVMGSKAMLVVDGQTQIVAVGDSVGGVRLRAISGDTATVERGGQTLTLKVGATPMSIGRGGVAMGSAREISIPAGPGGHFMIGGAINGVPTQFMVDTGATLVGMSESEARRLGVDLRRARRTVTATANGSAPALQIVLPSVRVGEVDVTDVEALVTPAAMPYVLLGNSFLNRFEMRRAPDQMRLFMR
jgi:aspartyl protease family protein